MWSHKVHRYVQLSPFELCALARTSCASRNPHLLKSIFDTPHNDEAELLCMSSMCVSYEQFFRVFSSGSSISDHFKMSFHMTHIFYHAVWKQHLNGKVGCVF